MPRKTLDIHFPMGVSRRLGLRDGSRVEGYPSPWSLNVRLEDSLTNRLRGGSFTAQAASTITTSQYVNLVTEAGDQIVTEAGDPIVLGPQYGVATGHDRAWVSPGPDAPVSGTADCFYRARLFRVDGNQILVSRLGDVSDWDYGGDFEDSGRATILQLGEAGEVGGNVIALVPHKDAFLLGFTADQTWILQGDPVTGTLRRVSPEVGIIAARAWCKNHDTVYFLSSQGLYSVGADGSGLKAVSENKIPKELRDVTDSDCVLDFYQPDNGVYIHLTTSPSWFYDTARDQFWPFDTTKTDSHVLIGPIKLGTVDVLGMMQTVHGIMAAGSATVNWRIVPGETAEQAADNGKAAITAALAGGDYSSYVRGSGSWSAGKSQTARPRTTAMWACIWLSSAGVWAFEGLTVGLEPAGSWRK